VLIIFGYKISGAHYNPAISLAFMFRRDIGHFPRPLGIAYIIFQLAGGVLGALLSWFFMESTPSVYPASWKKVF
jgi:glycerol uptake facilitator-like aquaporin